MSIVLDNEMETLAEAEVFGFLGKDLKERLLSKADTLEIADGQELFRQGDLGTCAYLVLSGHLDVIVDIGIDSIKTATIGPRELVGEIAIFTQDSRSATVIARGPARLLRIESTDMMATLDSHPKVARAMIADLGRRLAAANQPLAFLSAAAQALGRRDFEDEALTRLMAGAADLGPFTRSFRDIIRQIQGNQARHQEMALAAELQRSVLPRALPEGISRRVRLDGFMRPTREVGGDLYDFFAIDNRRLAVVIADVSGKGVPASLFMMMCRTVLHSVATGTVAAEQCLQRANAVLADGNDLAMFVTLFFGILDLETGEFTYCNAGHNSPYVLGPDGRLEALPATGPALAILDAAEYSAGSVILGPGDLLFMFTDGVTEAWSTDGEMYGEDRLTTLLEGLRGQSPADVVAGVVASVDRFSAGLDQADDITCLALMRNPGACPPPGFGSW